MNVELFKFNYASSVENRPQNKMTNNLRCTANADYYVGIQSIGYSTQYTQTGRECVCVCGVHTQDGQSDLAQKRRNLNIHSRPFETIQISVSGCTGQTNEATKAIDKTEIEH